MAVEHTLYSSWQLERAGTGKRIKSAFAPQLRPHKAITNRASSNPVPPWGMGNQSFFPPSSSPDVKDENCWIHSSAISSDPVHHSGERHSWLAHAALLHFPCCSPASSPEQRCCCNRDVEKEQSSSTGRISGARTRETLQLPLLHPCGLRCCAAELEASIICFLAQDKQIMWSFPPQSLPYLELSVSDSLAWKTVIAWTWQNSPKRWQLFWYEVLHPAVFKRRAEAVRRCWFQCK